MLGTMEWKVIALPPTQKEITSEISSIHSEIEIHKKKDFQMIVSIAIYLFRNNKIF
jgi:hypothetical protein